MSFKRDYPIAIRDLCDSIIAATSTPRSPKDDGELDLLAELIADRLDEIRSFITDSRGDLDDNEIEYLRRQRICYASLKLALWLADGRDVTKEGLESLWTYLKI